MERSSRFSFRRKNSQPHKDKDSRKAFDINCVSYVSAETAKMLYGELLNEYRLTIEQILEMSGFLCASLICKIYPKSILPKGKGSILVCCGPGRNGAEGLVCARHLKLFGYKPTVFYPKPASDGVNQILTDQCERHGLPFLYYLPSEPQLIADSYNAVVDAIYGFNFEGPPSNDFNHIIHVLIKTKLPIISINLPSGWNDEDFPTNENDESFIQPETLLSLLVPLECSKSFRGRNHYLLGHLLLPQDLTSKYDLILPSLKDSENSCFDMLSVQQGHQGCSRSQSIPANNTEVSDL